MSTFKLYSKQGKISGRRGLRYNEVPPALRYQTLEIFGRILGFTTLVEPSSINSESIYEEAQKILSREYGQNLLIPPRLSQISFSWNTETVTAFFMAEKEADRCLDVIQVVLTLAKKHADAGAKFPKAEMSVDEGISELNERFKEHGIGFQFVDGQIVKIKSELVYQSATLPALKLLRQPFLAGANQEFLNAQEHFRHGRYKECLNECLKAFESTMKAICHKRKWPYNQTDTAKTLIGICETNKLFPVFMQSHVTALRTILESGVPTARNKTSGHGQGVTPITVSEDFASYVLNLTAANILFFASAEQKLK